MPESTLPEPALAVTRLAGSDRSDRLLVLAPGLGTSVEALWSACAAALGDSFEVLGVDLPGHGRSAPATAPFTVGDLAGAVRTVAQSVASGRRAWFAGVSLGGAIGIELALEPGPFAGVAALAAAARFGESTGWQERAALVRRAGTPVMVSGSSTRWFADGFIARDPRTANQLLLSLSDTDDESYALCCEALSRFDRRADLGRAQVPVLFGPGAQDIVITPAAAQESADALPRSSVRVFQGCAHQPPAEAPEAVADCLITMFQEPNR